MEEPPITRSYFDIDGRLAGDKLPFGCHAIPEFKAYFEFFVGRGPLGVVAFSVRFDGEPFAGLQRYGESFTWFQVHPLALVGTESVSC